MKKSQLLNFMHQAYDAGYKASSDLLKGHIRTKEDYTRTRSAVLQPVFDSVEDGLSKPGTNTEPPAEKNPEAYAGWGSDVDGSDLVVVEEDEDGWKDNLPDSGESEDTSDHMSANQVDRNEVRSGERQP